MKTTSVIKFATALAGVLTVMCASAEYMYLNGMVRDAKYNGEATYFDYLTVKGNGTDSLDFIDSETGVSSTELASGKDDPYGNYSYGNYSYGAYGDVPQSFFVKYDSEKGYSTFLFELWSESETSTDRVAWQTFTASQVAEHTFSTSSGANNPLIVSQVIPEPTSGLLLLFGLAGLALRRRMA